jgi:hypothetical protein
MAGSKLKASSIFEMVISMVIIVVVFTIAMSIFANVQRLSLTGKKIKAQATLNEELIKAEQNIVIAKTTTTIEDFKVEKEISIYNNNSSLYQVSLAAYDGNQEKIAEINSVVYHVQ